MKTISIRELHEKTGKWVREAAASSESLIVLDRGRPTARLVSYAKDGSQSFAQRSHVKGFDRLRAFSTDSGRILEEDRK